MLINYSTINILTTNNDDSLIMISIFDILIYMVNNRENIKVIKKSNCIQFIKNIIYNNKKIDANIYLLKSYELLSNIILNIDNLEDKKNIITYIYQNDSKNNTFCEPPFVKELIEYIKIKDKSFIYIIINNITSLINKSDELCQLYCSNKNVLNLLVNLFNEKTSKKIKNEIIIFFINVIENNNIKNYKNLLNTEIFVIFISYISKKVKAKNDSTKIIIYNILYFINKCLSLEDDNNMNEIIKILEKYKLKETIEILIDNKDESISDISRSIFIKYFSVPENEYSNTKDNKDNKDIENMIID
jgi:hypothetical protein